MRLSVGTLRQVVKRIVDCVRSAAAHVVRWPRTAAPVRAPARLPRRLQAACARSAVTRQCAARSAARGAAVRRARRLSICSIWSATPRAPLRGPGPRATRAP